MFRNFAACKSSQNTTGRFLIQGKPLISGPLLLCSFRFNDMVNHLIG
jgi:hypothetical protein